jgi:hypothetical protein
MVNLDFRNFIADHIRLRESFAVETTLRSDVAIKQAKEAKDAGFRTEMYYIATENISINLERVIGGSGRRSFRARRNFAFDTCVELSNVRRGDRFGWYGVGSAYSVRQLRGYTLHEFRVSVSGISRWHTVASRR